MIIIKTIVEVLIIIYSIIFAIVLGKVVLGPIKKTQPKAYAPKYDELSYIENQNQVRTI